MVEAWNVDLFLLGSLST